MTVNHLISMQSYEEFLTKEESLNPNSAAFQYCLESYDNSDSVIWDAYLAYLVEGSQHLDEEV